MPRPCIADMCRGSVRHGRTGSLSKIDVRKKRSTKEKPARLGTPKEGHRKSPPGSEQGTIALRCSVITQTSEITDTTERFEKICHEKRVSRIAKQQVTISFDFESTAGINGFRLTGRDATHSRTTEGSAKKYHTRIDG